MAVFAVNYDLRAKAKPDYADLYAELERSPNWWHHLESTWLIVTDETAQQLWNRIARHVHRGDSVLVVEVGDDRQGWLPSDAWEWIAENLACRSA